MILILEIALSIALGLFIAKYPRKSFNYLGIAIGVSLLAAISGLAGYYLFGMFVWAWSIDHRIVFGLAAAIGFMVLVEFANTRPKNYHLPDKKR